MQGNGQMNQKDMTFNWKVRPQNKIVITVLRPQNFAGGASAPTKDEEMDCGSDDGFQGTQPFAAQQQFQQLQQQQAQQQQVQQQQASQAQPAQQRHRKTNQWEFHVESGFPQAQQQGPQFHHHQPAMDKRSVFAGSHSAKSKQYTSMPNMSRVAGSQPVFQQFPPQGQFQGQAPRGQAALHSQPRPQSPGPAPSHLGGIPAAHVQQGQFQFHQQQQPPSPQPQLQQSAQQMGRPAQLQRLESDFFSRPLGAFQGGMRQTPNPFEKNRSAPGIIEQMRNMQLDRVRQEAAQAQQAHGSVSPPMSPPASPGRGRTMVARKSSGDAESVMSIQGGVKKRHPPRPFEKIPSAPDGLVVPQRPRMYRTNSMKGRAKLCHPGHQAPAFSGAMELELPTYSEIELDVRGSPARSAQVSRSSSASQADKMAIASLLSEPMSR